MSAVMNLEIFNPDTIDKLAVGTWKEIPAPAIQYKLDPGTMPLIAEHRSVQADSWKFMNQIQDRDLDSGEYRLKSFWEPRKAGDETTVPDPSFIGQQLQDMVFTQTRLVFLTADTVVSSFAGETGLFWGISAQATIPADPIDLTIGNVVAAEALVPQGPNLWILTPQSQHALYPSDNSGGWSPQNMRLDEVGNVACVLDFRVWSNGLVVCCGSVNGLLLNLVLESSQVQQVEISARCPTLLRWPLSPEAPQEGDTRTTYSGWDGNVISRCFLPAVQTQVAVQRAVDGDTRLLLARQVGDVYCWSHCEIAPLEDTRSRPRIISLAEHDETLLLLLRDGNSYYLESLHLGDREREEDCLDHRVFNRQAPTDYDGGVPYESRVQFSAPVLFDQSPLGLAPVRRTQFNTIKWTLHLSNIPNVPQDFTLETDLQGRETVRREVTDLALGYSQDLFLKGPRPQFASFTLPMNCEARFFNVRINSESASTFEVLGGEWEARISGPEGRRQRAI